MFKQSGRLGRALTTSLLAFVALPAIAVAAEASVDFNIPAGSLDSALKRYAAATHLNLLYRSESVSGKLAPAVVGRYQPQDALRTILSESDMVIERAGPSVFVLRPRSGSGASPAAFRAAAAGEPGRSELAASASDPHVQTGPKVDPPPAVEPPSPPSEIVVTGSHIRGAKANASPLVTLTRDEMQREGDATVADALARLPQNFAGTANPVATVTSQDRTGSNASYAQGVNLRGLGSSATLVLINGRRMAGSGNFGDFADFSALPSAAVDHVEVLLDGASAIYGSDAVGGVVNIITRKNFEGAESSFRIGDDEGGGGASVLTTQALGLSWPDGHALLTYEYQHTNRLSSSSRDFAANSDLRPLGGTNHDSFYSSPGNLLGFNADYTAFIPIYAIPGGSGVGLIPSSFNAGSVNYQNSWHETDIAPQMDRNGFYVEASQTLDPKTTVDIEARYSLRHYSTRTSATQTVAEVTSANPYFVSPDGSSSELIGYSLDGAAGPVVNSGDERNYDFTLGATRDLWRDWKLNAYVGAAGAIAQDFSSNYLNSAHLDEALGTTPDDPTTSFSTAKDGFYNLYGTGASNSAALKAFVSDGYLHTTNLSMINVASLEANGSVWTLPGGTIKAAFGLQFRHERFEPSDYLMISSAPYTDGGVSYRRDVTSAYGELNIPIVGPASGFPWIYSLDLSVAGRIEHYDDVGTTSNPKLGLTWRPISDLTIRGTYGTSFRAPALSEIDQPTTYLPASVTAANGAPTLVLLSYGGNADLKPETATSWTAGVDWAPKQLPGFRLGATWFDIEFTNLISDPGVLFLASVLSDPGLASIVRHIDPSNAADEAAVNALLAKATASEAAEFPASAYGAIVDARYINTASEQVRGVDLNGSYVFNWAGNAIGVTGLATYLYTYSQNQVAGGLSESYLDTPTQPVNFRGKAALDWGRGPYHGTLILNYVNSYKDPVAKRSIDAWTTLDATVSWTSPVTSGPFRGVVVSASVQNLFDTDPPFYDSGQGVGFDSANANPFGRVVSLQVSKRW